MTAAFATTPPLLTQQWASLTHSGLLLQDVSTLEANAKQVHQLLEGAKDRDALLSALPMLLEPRTLISVLITVVGLLA